MIGIMLYYWRDARYHRAQNRQMLRDTGLVKSPTDWALGLLMRALGRKSKQKRPARWCRT